jgi:hypothetical protein
VQWELAKKPRVRQLQLLPFRVLVALQPMYKQKMGNIPRVGPAQLNRRLPHSHNLTWYWEYCYQQQLLEHPECLRHPFKSRCRQNRNPSKTSIHNSSSAPVRKMHRRRGFRPHLWLNVISWHRLTPERWIRSKSLSPSWVRKEDGAYREESWLKAAIYNRGRGKGQDQNARS